MSKKLSKKLSKKIFAILLVTVYFIEVFLPTKVQAKNIEKQVEVMNNSTDEPTSEIIYIYNFAQLASIDLNLSSHYVLKSDIEINVDWEPISNFTGIFDGNGHTITYSINETTGAIPNDPYIGLFASCTDAEIKNLFVTGNISLTTGGSFFNPNIYVGGIVANSTNSTLENVHFSGNINVTTSNDNNSWIGGIVGKANNNTQILLSSNTAPITTNVESMIGSTKAGGICGELDGIIQNCYNMGDVLATAATESPYAGGITGKNNATIIKSYNSGKVQAEGSDFSLSDVYAGGIAAIGETSSSISDCAVMSPEINVSIGWINSGYKYIIANGGNKSNNISINSILGSPINDSNAQYTQSEMKTSIPYTGFDFYNTWKIDETINNGYPYLDKNIYAIDLQYEKIPSSLKVFINLDYINSNDIKQTNDGFTLCTKSLGDILLNMGINEIKGNNENEEFSSEILKDWYVYAVEGDEGIFYSILKMRTGSEQPATAIPFMDFNIQLINYLIDDTIEQTDKSNYEALLYNSIDCLTRGVVSPNYDYCVPIADYFANVESEANYLIAEEYIKKVLSIDRDINGYINVPTNISTVQENFLSTLPNIYNEENKTIKVKKYNLTIDEKHAILACRTGNLSFNTYAAENIAHAMVLKLAGTYMQNAINGLPVPPSYNGIAVDEVFMNYLFECAIKADAGIDEESVPKDIIAYGAIAPALQSKFGDI